MLHVEKILQSSYPSLCRKIPPIVLRPCISFFKKIHEKEVNSFLNENSRLSSLDFTETILEYLDISYTFNQRDIENIPSIGKVIIVSNHPLGTADALALINRLANARQDKRVKIVANKMLSHIPQLSSLLTPIDNIQAKFPRSSLQKIDKALENEEAIIFFPAGEVSRASYNGIKDGALAKRFYKDRTEKLYSCTAYSYKSR